MNKAHCHCTLRHFPFFFFQAEDGIRDRNVMEFRRVLFRSIVIYTNDDKGSYDPKMTSQELARIRKAEEEVSEGLLGTPKENIIWMGYDDGMLEYAPQPKIGRASCRERV